MEKKTRLRHTRRRHSLITFFGPSAEPSRTHPGLEKVSVTKRHLTVSPSQEHPLLRALNRRFLGCSRREMDNDQGPYRDILFNLLNHDWNPQGEGQGDFSQRGHLRDTSLGSWLYRDSSVAEEGWRIHQLGGLRSVRELLLLRHCRWNCSPRVFPIAGSEPPLQLHQPQLLVLRARAIINPTLLLQNKTCLNQNQV